ncbi:MAG: AraC family transcriptional regulator [Clostridia bacterium]|nr:AraC family transcriptional regulator [Clostridia bacterium]
MKLSQIVEKLNLKVVTDSPFEDREISGGYVGDLLSWVMGKAESGNIWITIMSNVNIVAVAALTDVACILLGEGVIPEEDVIKKANMQDIIILSSDKTAFELSNQIGNILKL